MQHFPNLRNKTEHIFPPFAIPHGEPVLSNGMDKGNALIIYWTAHFGIDHPEAIANAILSSLSQCAVPDSDSPWTTRLVSSLARHHLVALRHAMEAFPSLLVKFERYTAFTQGRRLLTTHGESAPLSLMIPHGTTRKPLDWWNLNQADYVIFDDIVTSLALLKKTRFFCSREQIEETGRSVDEIRDTFWKLDGFTYLTCLVAHNMAGVEKRRGEEFQMRD